MSLKAILTVGISCSGKTTWAEDFCRKNGWMNINRDNIRFGGSVSPAKTWAEYKFSKANEKKVTALQSEYIALAKENEVNIVISDTNLNPNIRRAMREKLEALGYEVEEKAFPVALEEAYKRDAHRYNGVGQSIIYSQWEKWLDYVNHRRYSPNELDDAYKPKTIVFDVDGTLAHMRDRGPFEWAKVGTDEPDEIVCSMMRAFKLAGYQIIVVSGRDGSCYNETWDWLEDKTCFSGLTDVLFMRDAGDRRKDTIVKEEIFWGEIEPHYHVVAVVDDRPSVIRMWLDLGLKVISVGNPYKEF